MYCPKCGNRQVSEDIRFCAKCGLPLETVTMLVTTGNVPMVNEKTAHRSQISPRTKGILQGIAIVPASIGAWLLLDIIYEGLFGAGMLGGLYAMFTLILLVALLRILYAVFHEEGPTRHKTESTFPHGRESETLSPAINAALPAPTSEMVQPLSVTEKTTRQLDVQGK